MVFAHLKKKELILALWVYFSFVQSLPFLLMSVVNSWQFPVKKHPCSPVKKHPCSIRGDSFTAAAV